MIEQDFPGENTELDPLRAPEWLEDVVSAAHQRSIRIPLTAGSSHTGRSSRLVGSLGSSARDSSSAGKPPSPVRSKAAVLVLFTGDPDWSVLPPDAGVVLTHRSPHLRSHSGQCAFPGGKIDPGDKNVVDTALREAWEEIGLDRRSVDPLTQLLPAHVRRSGTPVCPVLAYWRNPMEVGVHSPEELDAVFSASLWKLANPNNRVLTVQGDYEGPGFYSQGYLIWGFTARILAELMEAGGWIDDWRDSPSVNLEEALRNSRNHETGR